MYNIQLKNETYSQYLKPFLLILFSAVIFSSYASARTPEFEHKAGVGIRSHSSNSAFEEMPYSSGDTSYQFYYEIYDLATSGFWQIVFGSVEDPKNSEVRKIYSQQLNLVLKDRFYRGGLGILNHCIVTDDSEEWSDTYYQFILGVYISFTENLGLGINGYYLFEKLDEDTSFDSDDIEYSLMLDFKF